MAELTKDSAARIMSSRKFIAQPGKYQVRVTNDPEHLASLGSVTKELNGGGHQVSIANFAAYTPYHLEQFRALAKEGDFNAAVNNNLTSSIRATDYMPKKNEIVEIMVDYITTKNGEEALLVVSYTPVALSVGGKIDLESIFGDVEDNSKRVELKLNESPVEAFEAAGTAKK